MNLFVFGLGYSARHFIRRHRARLGEVAGTTTSPEAAAALKGEGVRALLFDGETADPAIAAALAGAELLIASIPPDGRGDPALRSFEEAITAAPRLSWIGYLSTVGVYGDHGGRWVDETTPPAPANDRSRDRAAAEEAWLGLGVRSGKAVQVFRLAGIYGPGRNALAQLAAGTARCIVKPGQVFNRIHVDDIAAVLTASVERPNPGRIYNLAMTNRRLRRMWSRTRRVSPASCRRRKSPSRKRDSQVWRRASMPSASASRTGASSKSSART
jgi:nucleoside-diphosphate-sugar epimerase